MHFRKFTITSAKTRFASSAKQTCERHKWVMGISVIEIGPFLSAKSGRGSCRLSPSRLLNDCAKITSLETLRPLSRLVGTTCNLPLMATTYTIVNCLYLLKVIPQPFVFVWESTSFACRYFTEMQSLIFHNAPLFWEAREWVMYCALLAGHGPC